MKTLVLRAADGSRIHLRSTSRVGSSPAADLFVCAVGVEAAHASLSREAGAWYVRQEEGRVLRNGIAVEAAPLREGDRITFGSASFQVEALRISMPRNGALVAAGLAIALVAILFAEPAHPDGGMPQIELPTDGTPVRWEGESRILVLEIPVIDPRRVELELRIEQEGSRRPFTAVVEGRAIARREAGEGAPISLRGHLQQGTNEVRLIAEEGPLRRLAVALDAIPVPDCLHADCTTPLRSATERADRLEREKEAAPGNLFEAWRLLRGARGLAIGLGAHREERAIVRRLHGLETALEARCAALEFAAARHLALDDASGARAVADRILASFPGRTHRCHGSGERLLAILGGTR